MDSAIEALGIAVVLFVMFGSIFGFLAFNRYLRYKETIELARQGIVHPKYQRRRKKMNNLSTGGMIVFAIGSALFCGLATIGLEPGNVILGPWLLGGLIPMAVGGSLIMASYLNGEDEDDDIRLSGNDGIPPHKLK